MPELEIDAVALAAAQEHANGTVRKNPKPTSSMAPSKRQWESDGFNRWQECIDMKFKETQHGPEAFEIQVSRINDAASVGAGAAPMTSLTSINGETVAGNVTRSAIAMLQDAVIDRFQIHWDRPCSYLLKIYDKRGGVGAGPAYYTQTRVDLPHPTELRRDREMQAAAARQMGAGSTYAGAGYYPPPATVVVQTPAAAPAPAQMAPPQPGETADQVYARYRQLETDTIDRYENMRTRAGAGAAPVAAPAVAPVAVDEITAMENQIKMARLRRELAREMAGEAGMGFTAADIEAASARGAAAALAAAGVKVGAGSVAAPVAAVAAAAPVVQKTLAQQLREAVGIFKEVGAAAIEIESVRDMINGTFGAGASDAIEEVIPPPAPAAPKYTVESLGKEGFGYRQRVIEKDDDGNEIEPPPETFIEKGTNLFVGSPALQEMTMKGVVGVGRIVAGAAARIAEKIAGTTPPMRVGAGSVSAPEEDAEDGIPD